ncbi:MAG TPA: response regulator [Candidatus Angelobacter sp.]|jgi:CheY-like chemotaxis protein|nr:response regulator [Candidatus Angelobacter sp.]
MATILSVDDELNPLILRKLLLESAGHRVLSASSGIETLRILQVEKPDLVLTDHLMPGMTGAELAREIKARYPEMPVIIVTGLHELPAGAAVADLVMHKLERRATLLGNIEKILHREAVSSDEATGSSSSADPASN